MFDTWDEAAQHSKGKKAVATFGMIADRNGKAVKAEVLIREGGDANIVYNHTGIIIRKATAAEVDGLRGWKPA